MAKVKSTSRKTAFPMTKSEFLAQADPQLPVDIAGSPFAANLKSFGTGSVGYYGNAKIQRRIGEKVVTFQVGLNITAVGSKDAE